MITYVYRSMGYVWALVCGDGKKVEPLFKMFLNDLSGSYVTDSRSCGVCTLLFLFPFLVRTWEIIHYLTRAPVTPECVRHKQ